MDEIQDKSKSSTNLEVWHYVAEGHLNITFTNRKGKIIRLRKEQRHIKKSKYGEDFFLNPDFTSVLKEKRSSSNADKIKHYLVIPNVLQTHRYIDLVVKQLMPAKWLPSVELFNLDENSLQELI